MDLRNFILTVVSSILQYAIAGPDGVKGKYPYFPSIYQLHEFHETCHSITFFSMKKDSKGCCDTTTLESIHTKDESKRGSTFAFFFGVN